MDPAIRVFICYSHLDKKWTEEGRLGLIPYFQRRFKREGVQFWWDREEEGGLKGGDEWRRKIFSEIDRADIAVPLISGNFSASDFIQDEELPRIHERYKREELKVLPILVTHIGDTTRKTLGWIMDLQVVPSKQRALEEHTATDAAWEKVKEDLLDELDRSIGECRKRKTEAARLEEERKQQEDARRAAEAARAMAAAEKAKAEKEAEVVRLAAERKRFEDARRAAEEEAARAKAAAEEAKVEQEKSSQPTIELLALLDGQEVHGAKVTCGDTCWETPTVLSLGQGDTYHFKLTHTDPAGHPYAGELRIAATWSGERTERVALSGTAVAAASGRLGVPEAPGRGDPTGKSSWDGAAAGQRREVDLGGGLKLELCGIPAGKFTMGEREGRHEVTLSKAFWLGRTPVTQAQWEAVMRNNPSHFKGRDLPVEQVNWDDASEFCKKLNAKALSPAGWKFALPTEAQWEYACRAGTTGDYAGSLDEMAWYWSNSGGTTHPVATKKPNAWGLHDMHGNVWEWCADWYAAYSSDAATDPTGSNTGSARVLRGGGWNYDSSNCTSAYRNDGYPSYWFYSYGFRVVLAPGQAEP
ncbi:MAG: SUMF1/EgtB/PvdO family nonheme iron enzyme [Verrucomicrobia bacterium]|nr:SUMF1/EgtB/PvdO family nonheme iron enzyme [Verrucomicrobiota bacterium]